MQAASETARPATNMLSKVFTNSSQIKNCNECQEWLKSSGLYRDQIVSITANESEIEEGDAILIVFYREQTIHKNPVPCDAIQFAEFDKFKSWEELLELGDGVMKESVGADIFSITRTPKNIGDARNQVVWFSKESGSVASAQVSLREFIRQDGDLVQALTDAKDWMNEHVPPHLLVGVTAHEDQHPNHTKVVRVIVAHKAGASPMKLTESAAKKNMPAGGLYTLFTPQVGANETWDKVVGQAETLINNRGGQEGYAITSSNTSDDDGKLIGVFSWYGIYEAQIEEDLRPAGCCTIF